MAKKLSTNQLIEQMARTYLSFTLASAEHNTLRTLLLPAVKAQADREKAEALAEHKRYEDFCLKLAAAGVKSGRIPSFYEWKGPAR